MIEKTLEQRAKEMAIKTSTYLSQTICCTICNKEAATHSIADKPVCSSCGSSRASSAMWWSQLPSHEKTRLCNISLVLLGQPRVVSSLTGREIEQLYDEEKQKTNR